MKVIAISAQKGGVGKTATAAAVGAALHNAGKRILYVDLDPQANLSAQLSPGSKTVTVVDVLAGAKITTAIIKTAQGSLIPSSNKFTEKDVLVGKGAVFALKAAIEPIKKDFDVCLIDCPPNLGPLTLAAMTAADGVIIPSKADLFSTEALKEIHKTITTVKRKTNPALAVYGVLITMYSNRLTVCRVMKDELSELAGKLGIPVYDPPIRSAVAVVEAQLGGSIFDTRNGAAEDYFKVCNTILKQIGG